MSSYLLKTKTYFTLLLEIMSSVIKTVKKKIVDESKLAETTKGMTNICCRIQFFYQKTKKYLADYSIDDSLKKKDYSSKKELFTSLQGSIYRVTKNNQSYIIKRASKLLVEKGYAVTKGRIFHVPENIFREVDLLKKCKKNKAPLSIVGFEDFFEDSFNYFLCMEDGDMGLFEFTIKAHQFIDKQNIEISTWVNLAPKIAAQMTEAVWFLHTKMNIAHLDVSTENYSIRMQCIQHKNKKIEFLPGYQVKLIDFGLAREFPKDSWDYGKIVGKVLYQAPEIIASKSLYKRTKRRLVFKANLADCWALGVSILSVAAGLQIFAPASRKDVRFLTIVEVKDLRKRKHNFVNIIDQYGKALFLTTPLVHLLLNIFQYEADRWDIDQIINHSWMKQYKAT